MKKFVTALLWALSMHALADAEAPSAATALVKTAPLRPMTLTDRISGYGTVAAESGATVNLNFPKAGRIDKLSAAPGQWVKKGQPLLEVTTDPATALAYDQAQNAVVFARGEVERMQSLLAQQLATRSQLDAAIKGLKDAEQALSAQQALGGGAKQDTLAAPFDGLVATLSVAQGDRFQAGANLVQLVGTEYLRTRLGVDLEDAQRVRVGMKVRLTSVVGPQRTAEGTVKLVAGQIDPQTQLVDVAVSFKGEGFMPGSRIAGRIVTSERKALAVPRLAVLSDNEGSYLFQIVAGKAHRVTVETGIEDGDLVEVKGKELVQAPVVVLGNYELEEGMAVREMKP